MNTVVECLQARIDDLDHEITYLQARLKDVQAVKALAQEELSREASPFLFDPRTGVYYVHSSDGLHYTRLITLSGPSRGVGYVVPNDLSGFTRVLPSEVNLVD